MPDFVAIAETEDVAELTTAVNDRLSEVYDSFEANKIGIVIPGSQTKSGKAVRLTVQEVLVPMYGSTKTDTLIDAESILGGTTWTDLTDGGNTTLHKHDIYAALAENEVITGQWLLSAATKLTFRAATQYFHSGHVGHLDVEAATSFDVNTILELEATTSTTGHITQAGTRLLHTYGGAGSNNLFAGLGAGNFTLSGAIGNVGLGSGALDSLTSGDYNVAGGFGSAQALTSTSYNTALGGFALGGYAGASYCVAIGYYALYDGQTTIGTTAVGTEAFHNMETGDYGVALGYAAGFYETAGSKLFIDNASRASEADGRVKALIYGVFDALTANQYLTINGHLYAREDSMMIGTAKWQFNAATEYINSGAAGYVDYAAATAHRFAADIAMGGNSITGIDTLVVGTTVIDEVVAAKTLVIGTEAEIGQWPASASYAMFGNADLDHSVNTNYALVQSSGGATYLNAGAGGTLNLAVGGAIKVNLTTSLVTVSETMRMSTTEHLEFNAATEYINSGAAGYIDTHWADDDKGWRGYSGANLLLTMRRVSGGAPTSTELVAPARLDLIAGGKLVLSLTGPNHIRVYGDNTYIKFGAGLDARISYNGANLLIEPKVVGTGKVYIGATADDDIWFGNARVSGAGKIEFGDAGTYVYQRADSYLSLVADGAIELGSQPSGDYTCVEADGTVVSYGAATVFDDIYIGFSSAKVPAANFPNWESFIGNLNAYTFTVNDYLELDPIELEHAYREDSNLELHVHWATNGTEGAAKYVKWEIEYTITNSELAGGVGDTFPATTVVSAETEIPAATADLANMYTSVATITGTNFDIGAILKVRVRRIASAGAAPAANPFGLMVGVHIEKDTKGSRTLVSK